MTVTDAVDKKLIELKAQVKVYEDMLKDIKSQKRRLKGSYDHETGMTTHASETHDYKRLDTSEEWIMVRLRPLRDQKDLLVGVRNG